VLLAIDKLGFLLTCENRNLEGMIYPY